MVSKIGTYDVHDGKLHKYSMHYLVGDTHEELKYLLRVGKYIVSIQNSKTYGWIDLDMWNMSLWISEVFVLEMFIVSFHVGKKSVATNAFVTTF